jgi:hypothetical protein
MKKREIKKLAKKIFGHAKEFERKKYNSEECSIKEVSESIEYCPYDEKISEKFFKFVTNLVKIKDKLSIDYYREGINIFCDLNRYKSNKYTTESNFEIRIDKEGFRLRRDYGSYLSFTDITFLEKIKPVIKEKNEIVTREKIVETVEDLTIELGLSRENNLDEILA